MPYVKPPNPHPALAGALADGRELVDILAYVNDGFVIDDRHLLAGRPDIVTIRLLPEASSQAKIIPRGFVMHTQGGSRKATNDQVWQWCNSGTGTEREIKSEPHLIGPHMAGGAVLQAIPFDVRADSNYLGNSWHERIDGVDRLYGHLSAETQDEGSATLARTPWSLEQLNVSAGFVTACAVVYRIRCTAPAYPTSSGIGHHSLHPAWSKTGHDCPRTARIGQMDWLRGECAKRLADYYRETGGQCP